MMSRYQWPSIAWACFIMILCGIPGDDLPRLTFLEWLKPDKIIHLILFGIQTILLIGSFRHLTRESTFQKHPFTWAVVLSGLYGIIVEILQGTVFINRSMDARDALANIAGALIGLWLFTRYKAKGPSAGT
ncbi:MAG: VanZ family protein [Bacteroidia bacterium]|nr:VanZ family protein [Bacteroidia bacterium]